MMMMMMMTLDGEMLHCQILILTYFNCLRKSTALQRRQPRILGPFSYKRIYYAALIEFLTFGQFPA